MVGDIKTKEAEKDNLINLMVGKKNWIVFTKTGITLGNINIIGKNLSHEKAINTSLPLIWRNCRLCQLLSSGRTELMKTVFGAYAKKNGEDTVR